MTTINHTHPPPSFSQPPHNSPALPPSLPKLLRQQAAALHSPRPPLRHTLQHSVTSTRSPQAAAGTAVRAGMAPALTAVAHLAGRAHTTAAPAVQHTGRGRAAHPPAAAGSQAGHQSYQWAAHVQVQRRKSRNTDM